MLLTISSFSPAKEARKSPSKLHRKFATNFTENFANFTLEIAGAYRCASPRFVSFASPAPTCKHLLQVHVGTFGDLLRIRLLTSFGTREDRQEHSRAELKVTDQR